MNYSARQLPTDHILHPSRENMPPTKLNKPFDSRLYNNILIRAKEYYDKNQLQLSIEYFTKVLQYEPYSLWINYHLAVAYLATNNFSIGLNCVETIVKINSHYRPNMYWLLAIAHNKLGNVNEAMKAICEQIDIDGNVEAYYYRARLEMQSKQYDVALKTLDGILEMNCQHETAMFLKLKCLKELDDVEAEEKYIMESMKLLENGNSNHLYSMRLQFVMMLYRRQRYGEGLAELDKMDKGENAGALMLRGKILTKLGKNVEAIIHYNEILTRHPMSKYYDQALAELAIYYMKERDFYEAFAHLRRSQYNKVSLNVLEQLVQLAEGVTFLMKKKFSEAISLLSLIQVDRFALQTEHQIYLQNLYYNSLAFAYFSTGQHSEALVNYRKIDMADTSTENKPIAYNISICEGILAYKTGELVETIGKFIQANNYLLRPESYFYTAVLINEKNMSNEITSEGFMQALSMLEQGLKIGESAPMYCYRAVLYLFLGMNSEALEDIDRAIERSEENVPRYFHIRGVIFMLDRNYSQAILEFGTAISIDEHFPGSLIEKAKCHLLSGEIEEAYKGLELLDESQQREYCMLFGVYLKNFREVVGLECENESYKELVYMMLGEFERGGPSGKLIRAIMHGCYEEVITLIKQAVESNVAIGWIEVGDLLAIEAYCHYRLGDYALAVLEFEQVEELVKESTKSTEYSEDDEKRLLLCKLNVILINVKRGHSFEAIQLIDDLLGEICEGTIYDELLELKEFLVGERVYKHWIKIFEHELMISDYLPIEECGMLSYKIFLTLPSYRVVEVETPKYEQFLTGFTIKDIDNRPEAPWIRRGEFGVIFTNDVQNYNDLNLKTEENEEVKDNRRLLDELKLDDEVIKKLHKLAQMTGGQDNIKESE